LLTEFVPGTPPYGWNFPKRNRLISGLSNGVLVVEAPKKSGSLITAELALEQGRDVFVIPGNIDSPNSAGSNALLREGASAVSTGWDIVGDYEALFPGKLRPSEQPGMAVMSENLEPMVAQTVELPTNKKEKSQANYKKTVDKDQNPPYSGVEKKLPELNEQEQRIVNELKQGERLTDEVIAATGIAAGQMLGVLTLLEIKGVIRRLPGNRIALK
jgi:DNA processing protein